MRIIDKLIPPPPDKRILLPKLEEFHLPRLGLKRKTQKVFTFAFDSMFYRGLGFNNRYETFIKPFEKIFPEESSIDDVLIELKEEVRNFVVEGLLTPEVKIGTYIPTKYGLLRTYTFPRTIKKSELLQSVELYIEQDIAENFPNTEVLYAYDILESEPDAPYRVLVVIVETEIVRKVENLFAEFNLSLDLISFEPICVINLGLLKNLPQPFAILYTDVNKILIVYYRKDTVLYESFSFLFTGEEIPEDVLNLVLWDIRNYIVLNDINNIFLAGIVTEYEPLMDFFLERLPIFGIITIDKFPERYALTYTLGERLLNG